MASFKKPTLGHRLQYGAFRAFEWAVARVSMPTTFQLGELIGRVAFHLALKARRQVEHNLRLAFGSEFTPAERTDLAAQIFERTGANFLCSVKVPFLTDQQVRQHLNFEGLDAFLDAADKGGLVMISPHMGNWELLAQAVFLTENRMPVGTHYRPLNNQLINRVIERRRKKRGLQLFAKRTSTHRLISFVRDGGALGILADQRVGPRGAACHFFGRPTTCSPLPHLIAKRSGARIFSLVCETTGPAHWRITFQEVPELSAQACASHLEAAWRRSPIDVFWFEDRWRLRGPEPLSFLKKINDAAAFSRPLRAVHLAKNFFPLGYDPALLDEQASPIDFTLPDALIQQKLRALQQVRPVDLFVCETKHLSRMKKLIGKALVIPAEAR